MAMNTGKVVVGGVTLILAGFTSMGVFTTSMFVKGSAAALVNTLIAAVAGAWVYTEA